MRNHPRAVSIHPYFNPHPGRFEEMKASLPHFVERTSKEPGCLFYGFTLSGETLFCQEAYVDGDAALAHLANVGDMLGELLKIADLVRLELHGPAEELEKLRSATAALNPKFFVWATGL